MWPRERGLVIQFFMFGLAIITFSPSSVVKIKHKKILAYFSSLSKRTSYYMIGESFFLQLLSSVFLHFLWVTPFKNVFLSEHYFVFVCFIYLYKWPIVFMLHTLTNCLQRCSNHGPNSYTYENIVNTDEFVYMLYTKNLCVHVRQQAFLFLQRSMFLQWA